jgi:hypothetical protein
MTETPLSDDDITSDGPDPVPPGEQDADGVDQGQDADTQDHGGGTDTDSTDGVDADGTDSAS